MRKLLLSLAALLAIGLGFAAAQNITKSVQLSQDPTGQIGYDTNNNVYFPAKVLTTGRTPTLSGGISGGTVTGSAFGGIITGVTGSSAGALTFGTAFLAQPYCVATSTNTATSPIAYNTVATGINFTTWTGALTAMYVCTGSK